VLPRLREIGALTSMDALILEATTIDEIDERVEEGARARVPGRWRQWREIFLDLRYFKIYRIL
jgi:hypothetical protein